MNKGLANITFFIGWLLSPLTWWNDPFVNMPLAYILATANNYYFKGTFSVALVAYYWVTNIFGLSLMFIGAKEIFVKGFDREKKFKWLFVMVIYTVILAALSSRGFIAPLFNGR